MFKVDNKDSKIYYTINKIRNDRKRAEINKGYTKNKDIYKEDIYKQYINKLQKPLFSRTLLKIVYKTELTTYQKMEHCLIKLIEIRILYVQAEIKLTILV